MPKPRLLRGLARSRIEPLHSDANAEKRNAPRNRRANCGRQPGRIQAFGRLKVAYTRQHNALSPLDERQIVIRHNRLSAQVPQRLQDAGQITRLVIDH